MEVIVITKSGKNDGEVARIIELFKQGLSGLHIRKPRLKKSEVEEYILSFPPQYRQHMVIHGHYDLAIKHGLRGVHLRRKHRDNSLRNRLRRYWLRIRKPGLTISASFHSLQSLKENHVKYDYVFLGQVMHSNSSFNPSTTALDMLRNVIINSGQKVYAQGGITRKKLDMERAAGFHGVVLSTEVLTGNESGSIESLHLFMVA
ncbi:MAG: thiamine phosphate synthase [Salibacteraceae bacterium]